MASLAERPLIVIWEVTRRCALACRHCRAEAQPAPHPAELTRVEAEALLDQIAEADPRLLVLTGGDPASRPDILDLIASADARGLRVAFSPSATPRLTRTNFDDLRRAGVRCMSLSLDGASAKSHDAFRGVSGAWDWTMQAFSAVRRARIPIQINTTFSKANAEELPRFVSLIERLRPAAWTAFLLVPTGRARREDMLDADQTEALLSSLSRIPLIAGVPVKSTEAPQFRRIVMQAGATRVAGELPWRFAPTNDGRGCVFVSHVGEIQPSGFLPIVCGNTRTSRLLDVYRESPHFQALRDPNKLRGKCGRCEYRAICGGSRSRAYAVTGDYLAEEPCCPHQPRRTELLAA